jgi:hypothetical protein
MLRAVRAGSHGNRCEWVRADMHDIGSALVTILVFITGLGGLLALLARLEPRSALTHRAHPVATHRAVAPERMSSR